MNDVPTLDSERARKRVLVVDDHPIVRQGLVQLLNQADDLAVCGEASDAEEALRQIALKKPDLAIVDISLGTTNGLDLVKQITLRFEALPVLVLSIHEESLYAERVLRAGARGYIMKQEATEQVVMAIRQVLTGSIYLSARMSSHVLSALVKGGQQSGQSGLGPLSNRELEVFRLIGKGCATREIASMLHLSIKTVESHREHIKEKLHLKSALELVQHAVTLVHAGAC